MPRIAGIVTRFFSLTLCCVAGDIAPSVAAQEQPLRLDRSQPRWDLTQSIDAEGRVSEIRSPEMWQTRRAGILTAMQGVMGDLPDATHRVQPALAIRTEDEKGEVIRFEIEYQSEAESWVPAYLFLPKSVLSDEVNEFGDDPIDPRRLIRPDAAQLPAALCLHPTDDHLGKMGIIGIPQRPTMGYALELAQRGYITIAPAYPLLAEYRPDLKKLGWKSGTLKAVWDNQRAIDLLLALGCVDPTKIAAIGHSLGGHNSVYSAVFDERISAVVSCCGLDAYVDYYQGSPEVWQVGRGWCSERYMLELARYQGEVEKIPFDFPEMIGALAPRSVLIIAPTGDDNFRADSVDRVAASARAIFELYQVPDRLKVLHPEGAHDFSDPMRAAAYEWLDEQLQVDR